MYINVSVLEHLTWAVLHTPVLLHCWSSALVGLVCRCAKLYESRNCGSVLVFSIQVCTNTVPRGKDISNDTMVKRKMKKTSEFVEVLVLEFGPILV